MTFLKSTVSHISEFSNVIILNTAKYIENMFHLQDDVGLTMALTVFILAYIFFSIVTLIANQFSSFKTSFIMAFLTLLLASTKISENIELYPFNAALSATTIAPYFTWYSIAIAFSMLLQNAYYTNLFGGRLRNYD